MVGALPGVALGAARSLRRGAVAREYSAAAIPSPAMDGSARRRGVSVVLRRRCGVNYSVSIGATRGLLAPLAGAPLSFLEPSSERSIHGADEPCRIERDRIGVPRNLDGSGRGGCPVLSRDLRRCPVETSGAAPSTET